MLGVSANVLMIGAIFVIGLLSGGTTTQATLLAIGVAAIWLGASTAYFVVNSRRKGIEVFPQAGVMISKN